MRQLADISLPVNPDLVANALQWLEYVGEQQSWPSRTRFKLQLCLDETLTNIAMHGYTGHQAPEPPQIKLQLSQEGETRLVLDIFDNGAPSTPRRAPPASLTNHLKMPKSGATACAFYDIILKTCATNGSMAGTG